MKTVLTRTILLLLVGALIAGVSLMVIKSRSPDGELPWQRCQRVATVTRLDRFQYRAGTVTASDGKQYEVVQPMAPLVVGSTICTDHRDLAYMILSKK